MNQVEALLGITGLGVRLVRERVVVNIQRQDLDVRAALVALVEARASRALLIHNSV